MKRELKFRFWLGHTKKMTYDHSLIDIAHMAWDFTEDIIPLQFTGLTDKEGTEIYEGDILKVDSWAFNWTVQFDKIKARFNCIVNKQGSQNDFIPPSQVLVIGNIFENPKLINEAK